VDVLETEHPIEALKTAGRKFESKVFKDIPGGHGFDCIKTRKSDSKFLASYLKPSHPLDSLSDLAKTR
jgi:hypothetical protein